MMLFDFYKLKDKYPILTDKDFSLLNNFFNQENIVSKFKELEAIRKKKLKIAFGIIIILDLFLLLIYGISLDVILPNLFGVIFVNFIIVAITFVIGRNIVTEIKTEIMGSLAGIIDPNLKYDAQDKYAFSENLLIKKGLLKEYDRLDKKEDSIKFDYIAAEDMNGEPIGGFKIDGYEFKSSNRHQDSKGRTTYTTNNHAYLLNIVFNNPIKTVEKEIILRRDRNDQNGGILGFAIALTLVCSFFGGVLLVAIFGERLKTFYETDFSNFIAASGVAIFAIFALVYFLRIKFINKKRIKLENVEFEKEFDVYCEDEVSSREILTPDFMYKIIDYTKKGKGVQHFEFYFKGNEIYIKRDLMSVGSYMEISLFSNLLQNAEQLILFYVEFKNSASLANDLGLYYFDRETFNSKVIK